MIKVGSRGDTLIGKCGAKPIIFISNHYGRNKGCNCSTRVGTVLNHPNKIYYYDLFFLRHCYDSGLISIDDVKRVQDYEEYFVPELNYVSDEYFLIDATIEELKKDDWKLFKENIKYGGPKNSLRAIIRRDDIDSLSLAYAKSEFNINDCVRGCGLEGLGDGYSLIDLAACYGAIQCFKFLLLHGTKIDDQTFQCQYLEGTWSCFTFVSRMRLNRQRHLYRQLGTISMRLSIG